MSRTWWEIQCSTQWKSNRKPPMGYSWHHYLWPWMTLNRPRSRSQDFRIKWLECGDRCNVGLWHNRGQIGNHQRTFDRHYELYPWWPWTVLVEGHYNYTSNISITVYGMQQHWADTHVSVSEASEQRTNKRWTADWSTSLRLGSSLTISYAKLQAAQSYTHVVFSQWINGRRNEEFQFIIVW